MSSKNGDERKVLKKKRSEMVTKKPIFKAPRLEDAPSIQRKNQLSGTYTNWPIISSQYQPKPLIKPPKYTNMKRQETMDDDSDDDGTKKGIS